MYASLSPEERAFWQHKDNLDKARYLDEMSRYGLDKQCSPFFCYPHYWSCNWPPSFYKFQKTCPFFRLRCKRCSHLSFEVIQPINGKYNDENQKIQVQRCKSTQEKCISTPHIPKDDEKPIQSWPSGHVIWSAFFLYILCKFGFSFFCATFRSCVLMIMMIPRRKEP